MKENRLKSFILKNRFLKKAIRPAKYVKDVVVGIYVYFSYRELPESVSEKSIYLDIKQNVYNRYLYLFVKFFQLEGYKVYIRAYPVTLRYINSVTHANLIMKEKNISFSFRKMPGCTWYLSDSSKVQCLSADYFTDLLQEKAKPNDFYVPMAMHPHMYHQGWWKEEYKSDKKLRSVFFAGNCDRKHYSISEEDNLFKVIDRVKLYDLLKDYPRTFIPNSLEELEERKRDHEVVLVVKDKFSVPMQRLRHVLANYSFFLACPGYIMPFSHNVVEAMSVGSIPIIQASYAKMFIPALEDGVNALLFDDEASLLEKIELTVRLSEKTTAFLSANVLNYYHQYLTPAKVVKSLLEQPYDHIYLNAELPSVELLKKNLRKSKPLREKLRILSLPCYIAFVSFYIQEVIKENKIEMMFVV